MHARGRRCAGRDPGGSRRTTAGAPCRKPPARSPGPARERGAAPAPHRGSTHVEAPVPGREHGPDRDPGQRGQGHADGRRRAAPVDLDDLAGGAQGRRPGPQPAQPLHLGGQRHLPRLLRAGRRGAHGRLPGPEAGEVALRPPAQRQAAPPRHAGLAAGPDGAHPGAARRRRRRHPGGQRAHGGPAARGRGLRRGPGLGGGGLAPPAREAHRAGAPGVPAGLRHRGPGDAAAGGVPEPPLGGAAPGDLRGRGRRDRRVRRHPEAAAALARTAGPGVGLPAGDPAAAAGPPLRRGAVAPRVPPGGEGRPGRGGHPGRRLRRGRARATLVRLPRRGDPCVP